MTRAFVTKEQVTSPVRTAFGAGRRIEAITRLTGGSKKGVYRLALDDDTTALLYYWGTQENYWPDPPGGGLADRADPFSAASGLDLFRAAHARLDALGVRVPRIHLADASGEHLPGDLALVEDVPGGTLEELLGRDPSAARPALDRLRDHLGRMRLARNGRPGKVALVDGAEAVPMKSPERYVLDRALVDLADGAARIERLAAARGRVEERLRRLAADVPPRDGYALIHGELGPDHVLLDRRGEPVLIDIEGAMFFDVEWEHIFLRLRFAEHYRWLRADGLDERRLRCYALAMHLSLVAGPLRLLDGDFPHRERMLAIVAYNLERVLAFPN
ncbi:phosphotransferase [Micromonospora sp. NPDC049559]|uniref:phosphotransferase n=1 Tax=Micromonospora sp. NPDC049559 TaxID=3155923 RepID=UPI003449353F